jgi:hypothetical protein
MDNLRDKAELEKLQRQRIRLDRRIDTLEKLTLNGEDEWFIQVVRKDPSCAIKIIKECSHYD